MASPSSSSSSKRQFDVFVSFNGADTGNFFTFDLIASLRRKGIDVFSDKKLLAGEDISALFERIEQSKMYIVVFSKNYADSTWCLDELRKIIQCMKTSDHRVLPVFYKVDPSDVRKQRRNFGDAFDCPKESFKEDGLKIQEWRDSLTDAANLFGFVILEDAANTSDDYLHEEWNEAQFIENVTQYTFTMLNDLSPYKFCGFPGIESRSKELEELLMFDNADCVRIIGVHGMQGIGKTEVALSVYKQNCRKFDGYHFVDDIDKEWKQGRLFQLSRDLLDRLRGVDMDSVDVRANRTMEDCLRNKKLFIVLDNVTNQEQIDVLIGEQALSQKGSRIVIITRDKKLLQNKADATYVVPRLNDREAMQLFCLTAFPVNFSPPEEFVDLSNSFVCYSKGHPLALKFLGWDLCRKEKSYWKEKWEDLKEWPHKEIQKELTMSYDELDDDQKLIFLDIACFFRSEKADFVTNILKSNRVNAAAVIKELEDKCLVTISNNRIEMHDLLHQMGKYIGCELSIRKVGKRSRLWNPSDIRHILEKNLGSEYVRGIFLNMSDVERVKISPVAFKKMSKLKFLKFHNSKWCENDNKFQFCEGLDYLPEELVYLHWQGYPYEYLPSEFNPVELVDLSLRYSCIKQLWEDERNTESLRWVDLSQSKDLLNLSDLSRAKNLERLDLEGCTSLVLLGSSIEQMHKLIYLNLRECTKLESLPKGIKLKSLKTLILSGCSNLQDFQILSENIESLDLEGTAIEQVVEHIECLHNLILLNLKNCRRLRYLPDDLYKMKCLQELILSGCSALESLPPIKEEMGCLEILRMDGTSIKHTPEMIYLSNLKVFSFCESSIKDSTGLIMLPFSGSSRVSELYLTNCNIKKLPDNFSSFYSLQCLCLSRNNIETLPESIEKIYSLLLLDLKHCHRLHSLPVLPSGLQCLDAHGCVSLEKVAKPVTLPLVTEKMHTSFIFTDCFKLNRAEQEDIVAQALLKSQLLARASLRHNPKGQALEPLVAVCFPGSDISSWFSHHGKGSSVETKLPPNWNNNKFIGASLCVVVTFKDQGHLVNHLSVRCKGQFKNQNGQTISFSFHLGGWNKSCGSSCHEPRVIGSDHVFISYNNFNVPVFEWSDNCCHSTSASFEFYLTDETEKKLECCEVTRCGMSLLYAPDENDREVQGIRVSDIVERRPNEVFLPTRRILALLKHSQPSGAEFVGIWGMAGIGKTTIAREVYEILASQYHLCYLSENFFEMCQKKGLRQMHDDFFAKVFADDEISISASDTKPSFMKNWFQDKKILVFLDDVRNARDVEAVLGGFDWFSRGHRIILTSRRKQVLVQCRVQEPYEIQKLCETESLRLCKRYLNEERVISELMSCSSGIPLALDVLASSVSKLHHINDMLDHLQTLRRNPPTKLQETFLKSYEGLDENEKNIFLDLACFFREEKMDHVVHLLDACGFFTYLGICDLVDHSLISLVDNKIEIPIPFQDIGRFIVHKIDEDPCKRSRLWDSKDISIVLEKDSGGEAIEGIFLDASDLSLVLSPTVFSEMYELRLLKIYCSTFGNECKLSLPEGLDSLPDELRLLHWENYPLKYLPQRFDPENLVELNMPYSEMEKLWEGKKNLEKLKKIKLSHSKKLTDITMLLEAWNLEHIDLEGCTSLVDISTSLACEKLVSLNIKDCSHLQSLPSMVDLASLKLLDVSGCSELNEIQYSAPNLE